MTVNLYKPSDSPFVWASHRSTLTLSMALDVRTKWLDAPLHSLLPTDRPLVSRNAVWGEVRSRAAANYLSPNRSAGRVSCF